MKKKILFIIESLAGGGAEKVLAVLTKHFNYDKYEVSVCSIVGEGVYCEEVKKCVAHYYQVISYQGSTLSRLWNRVKYKMIYMYLPLEWVYEIFTPKGYDVEIAFCEGFVTKLLSRSKSRSKKIAWVHTDLKDNPWPLKLRIYKDIDEEKETYSVFNKIICVSNSAHQSFCKLCGLEDKTITIYNPIDINDIRSKIGQKKYGDGAVRLISVGRLVPQKGFDRLLKVVKCLHDNRYCVHLLILGEGYERKALEKYVESHDMQSYVSLPGFYENPYQEMWESDLFVCSSRAEGFSLVIAEAMVLGIPVISTCCSGPNELLKEGKYGLLVDNSEKGLYEGIKLLFDNHAELDRLRELALSRGNMFGVAETMHRIEQLFDEL